VTVDYVLSRVERIPKLSDGNWDFANPEHLKTAFGVSVKKGIGDIKDSFSFRLPNVNNTFFDAANNLVEDDIVRIYQWKNKTTFTAADDLLIEGSMKTINEDIDSKGRGIIVNGFDFIETFFDNQVATVGDSFQQKTVPEMVQVILEESRRLLKGTGGAKITRNVFWANTGNGYTGTANSTLKSDGVSSFPTKNYVNNFRKVSDLLEELSSDKYTEDGQYRYWVVQQDVSGNTNPDIAQDIRRLFLIWRDTKDATQSEIITEGINTKPIKVKRNKDEVLNFIIYNSGIDLFSQPVQYFAFDAISIGKFGYKTKYMVEETVDIFNGLVQTEIENDRTRTLFTYDSDNRPTSRSPQSYPYTFQFNTRDDNFNQSTTKQTASSNNDYNNKLVREAEALGYFRAMRMIERSSKPKYRVDVTYNWRNDLVFGGNYQVSIPSRNLNRQLRLIEINYDKFNTNAFFEEDPKNTTYE